MVLVDGEPAVLAENKLPMQPAFIGGQYPETKGWFTRILYGEEALSTFLDLRSLTELLTP